MSTPASSTASPMGKRSSRKDSALILTCEHGGNRVPHSYRQLFNGSEELLESHRAYDAGAAELTRYLARRLGTPAFVATVSRLLVDLNRSPGNRNLFSSFSRHLSTAERTRLLDRHYWPHRTAVEFAIDQALSRGLRVIHVGVHTFTPVLNGVERTCDIGLLYDPGRRWESAVCAAWIDSMKERLPVLIFRRNYPYRGLADGFTTHLRTRFPDRSYAGVELEVNQRLLGTRGPRWGVVRRVLGDSISELSATWTSTRRS